MKLFVLACLVVLTRADHRFEELGEEIAHFAVDVLEFDATIHEREKQAEATHAEWSWFRSRINHIKGSGCDDHNEFQCGGDHPDCISRLLICDQENDCADGADESQCKIFTPVGSKWKATFFEDHCTRRKPHEIIFTITEYKVPTALLSFPEVSAIGSMEADQDDFSYSSSLHVHGVMDLKPGSNRLFFNPPETDGLAIECIFNGVHDDHCHGHVLYVSSQTPCATFIMRKMD